MGRKKSASATEKLVKRKFERVQRKISTVAISEIVFFTTKNKYSRNTVLESLIHYNYTNTIKLNVTELNACFMSVFTLNLKIVPAVIAQWCFCIPGSLQLRE